MPEISLIEQWLWQAQQRYPYLSKAWCALTPVEKEIRSGPQLTIAVDDRWRLYWCEQALRELEAAGGSPPELLLHEVMHLLDGHGERRHKRDHQCWNAACDAAINDDIPQGLPSWAVLPKHFNEADGQTPEHYYSTIPEDKSKKTCGGGSGVDGERKEYEVDDGDAPFVDNPENLREQVAADVQAAEKSAPGTLPGGIVQWAKTTLAPRIKLPDWRRLLRGRLATIARGRQDYSFAKGSRRQDSQPLILPGTIKHETNWAVVLDTSGSTSHLGERFAAVLHELCRMPGRKWLIDCDVQVYSAKPLQRWQAIMQARGGGGTNMCKGIEFAHSMRPRPALTVVVTDGETPWPTPWPANTIAVVVDQSRVTIKDR